MTVTCQAFEPWWLRPDPAALIPVKASDGFCQALRDSGGSLLVTSRQQGKVAIVTVAAGGAAASLSAAPGPMGAATLGSALALGTVDGVRIYQNVAGPDVAAIYVPAAMHYTGPTSVHDVGWGGDGALWFVNTRFSALCTVDPLLQFRAHWRPAFIPGLTDGDCCHLNGMAMVDGRPALVTALGMAGDRDGWRRTAPDGGILMRTDQIILRRGLSLPHDPRVREGRIWALESGHGRLFTLPLDGGDEDEVCRFDGVVRGLAFALRACFVGLSRPRPSSGAVSAIIAARFAGPETSLVHAIDPESGRSLGCVELPFNDEVSSVTLLPFAGARIAEPSADEMMRSAVFVEEPWESAPQAEQA